MKLLQKSISTIFFIAGGLFFLQMANAQCAKFTDSPKGGDAENAHVLYRQDVKTENFESAFENWKMAYEVAPAADGMRDSHFTDGIKIYKHFLKEEADVEKKKEYVTKIMDLYDSCISCLESNSIKLPTTPADKRIAYHLGRKAFDMFYYLQTPYSQTLKALSIALEKGGNDLEYTVLDPYARVVVQQFTNDLISKEDARDIYTKLNTIADHNIANNAKYKTQYEASKASMNAVFAQIENHIFDCDYFKNKLSPEYKELIADDKLDEEEGKRVKVILGKLLTQGCSKEEDPFVVEMNARYEAWAEVFNAKLMEEYWKENPGVWGNELYKEAKEMEDAGDKSAAKAKYKDAVSKYKMAIEKETTEVDKKADYHFSIASIQFRKLHNHAAARDHARKAAGMRSGWGKPYMLIGDMYGSTSRSCGDDWDSRMAVLAAIDKYAYAKSIDSSVADDANTRIGKYAAAKPEKQEGFMRGVKAGQSVKVGCWIGETVKVRFK